MNYGSCDLLASNLVHVIDDLRGLTAATPLDVVSVVVDNFTSPQERNRVAELCEEHAFEAVFADTNLGFGGGVNLGVERALALGVDRVLLLNPDALIDPDSVLRLAEHVDKAPMDLAAPVVHRPDGTLWSSQMDVYLTTGQLRASRFRPADLRQELVGEWVSGACLMISSRLWELTSGFDEKYFLYWEDVDLSYRVVQLGGRNVVVGAAQAVHAESGTQRYEGPHRSPLFYYYNTRNRLLFAAKHLAVAQQRRWVKSSVQNIIRMVRPEGLAALRPPWTSLRSLLRGELDGRRFLSETSPEDSPGLVGPV